MRNTAALLADAACLASADIEACTAESRTLSCTLIKSSMYVDLECVFTLKCGVRIPRFKSSLFPNSKCAGATLVRLLTELLMMRCTNGIDLAYPSRVCLSKTRPRRCLFTSLLTLSTIAFSCFEYERARLCGVPQRSKIFY